MKKKIMVFLFCFFLLPFCFGIINIIIDPMSKFNLFNYISKKIPAVYEREQKTNFIYRNVQKYDSVLFGSSRATFINQNDFLNMKVFNYAVNSQKLSEFKPYLDFFVSIRNKTPKNIILGLDFYHTNNILDNNFSNFNKPDYYIQQSKSFEDYLNKIFSLDILKASIKSIQANSLDIKEPYYNKDLVKIQNKVSEKTRLQRYKSNLIRHLKDMYGKNYFWDNEIFKKYKEIKDDYPNSKIIPFTQPITSDLFATFMREAKHFENYKKWISGLVDIYGEIYCFMGINSITINAENYADDDHYYPEIGKIIAYKLSTMDFDSEPKDFGVIVNKNNVDEFLARQEKELQEYKFSEFYPHDEVNKILQQK